MGAVGAHVVKDAEKYVGKVIEYSGPASTYAAFAKDFSAVLGRTINYIGVTFEQAEAALKARGLPEWLIAHQLAIARLAAKGGFSNAHPQPIRDILGREPISTRKFVEDHKAAFS